MLSVIRMTERITAELFYFFAIVLFTACFVVIAGGGNALASAKKDDTSTIAPLPLINEDGEQNWSAFFASPRPLVQDWRQYAARDEVKPELQTPRRILLERIPLRHDPTPLLLLTLQAVNIQVRENWDVTNALNIFDIGNNGELYLTEYLINKSATLVATVYLIDEFQILNKAYQNLTASAVITVEVMLGDLSVEQPPRLEVVVGVAEEVYVFDAHGGAKPHTYALLENPDANAFAFANGTLLVNISAAIGEYRFTVAVTDAASMSVTVVATVGVEAASTIMVDGGGGAIFLSQGEMVNTTSSFIFNPKSLAGAQVSAIAGAMVALLAPNNAWQITLYGGRASFAGVADGSSEVVVAMSLAGDSDFVRGTDEKVSLAYVFSDEVVVPVVPQGTRIFNRGYGGAWYLVIDKGSAWRGYQSDVNFLAFTDGEWIIDNGDTLDEEPFTLSDFAATVPYSYQGKVGEVMANYGVAPSFSLVGDSDIFTMDRMFGVLSMTITNPQQSPLTLLVTVSAEDNLGDMLGDYGYQNLVATATVIVEVEANPLPVLAEVSLLIATEGMTASLYTFTAIGGVGGKKYTIVAGNEGGFALDSNSGILSLLEDATEGVYTLLVEASDHASPPSRITVMVTVQVKGSQIFVLGGFGGSYENDVWSSLYGKIWSEETASAGWWRRSGHQSVAHNGRLYVLGGLNINGHRYNDVWSSANGKAWGRETGDAGWAGRIGHQSVSHNGRLYVLGGQNINSYHYNDVWSSVDGKTWVRETGDAGWSRRRYHQSVSRNGRLYVLGGYDGSYKNDVWSSVDGKTWKEETAAAGWSGRYYHQSVSHNGRLYVLGGWDIDDFKKNDVWSSLDGKTWDEETTNADWPGRNRHQSVSRNGRLYVLGGHDVSYKNDVWSSVDGKTWKEETAGAGWSGRGNHQAVVFPHEIILTGLGDRMILQKGRAADNLHTFTAQYGVGDYTYSLVPAVSGFAVSPDGVLSAGSNIPIGEYTLTVWVEDSRGKKAQIEARFIVSLPLPNLSLTDAPPLLANAGIASYLHIFGNGARFYTIAEGNQQGYFALHRNSGVLSVLADSLPGVYTLTLELTGWFGSTKELLATVEILPNVPRLITPEGFARKMHIFAASGGVGTKTYQIVSGNEDGYFAIVNDSGTFLSVSEEVVAGIYTLSVEASAGSTPSSKATVAVTVAAGSQIFILGGRDSSRKNDVWFSADGKAWWETTNAGWSDRYNHQAVFHNELLYVLGGYDGSRKNDVWSSGNGWTWEEETANAGWSGRYDHQSVSHNGRLYVLGGWAAGSRKNDVWSSVDGKTWEEETASAGWVRRDRHQSVSYNGRLYVLGGYDGSYKNDVWSSADGRTWVEETANAGWARRGDHQSVLHNGRLYVLGGSDGNFKSDVWSSADGKTWVEETANADWSSRWDHQSISRNGRLYVLGGRSSSGYINDVWSSADGKTWVEETANAGWARRYSHQAVVVPPELHLAGVGEWLLLEEGVESDNLHTFTAQYGVGGQYGMGDYTYSLVPAVSGFALSQGVLSANVPAGKYTLTVQVEDSRGNRTQTVVRVYSTSQPYTYTGEYSFSASDSECYDLLDMVGGTLRDTGEFIRHSEETCSFKLIDRKLPSGGLVIKGVILIDANGNVTSAGQDYFTVTPNYPPSLLLL